MDTREQRGLALAALYRIDRRDDGMWIVPSQSGNGERYEVDPDPEHPACTCPDHRDRGVKCKHMFAVEFVQTRERVIESDGTETVTVTETFKVTEKVTYKQQWPAYNKAQTREKRHFQELLSDLTRGLPDPAIPHRGQKPVRLADRVFSIVFKVYSTVSTRRFTCDLEDAAEKGFIESAPHYNSVCRFLEDADLTAILKRLIVESSKPLASVETDFAIDSSGFSTCRFVRWFDVKYGKTMEEREWVKVHIATGVKTNVITAVEILDKNANDSPVLPPLVKTTRETFEVREVSADAAYSGTENMQAVLDAGGTPYIAFKENATGGVGGVFARMFHYYSFNRDEFLTHYHKRSNVESTFSMLKGKFGDALRSKSDVAMVNEALCKILCHNLACLIQSMYELAIEPVFWGQDATDPAAVARLPEPVELEADGEWAWL